MKDGLATRNGRVFRSGRYFGHEMLLTDYNLPHGVTSLTYLSVFRILRSDLMRMLDSGQFPRMKVLISRYTGCVCENFMSQSFQWLIRRWTIRYIIQFRLPALVKQLSVVYASAYC